MALETMICPECGGIIGATETTDHGRPCTCFGEDAKSDTSVLGSPSPASTKNCCVCGKDITKRKRFKDSHGYWCKDCHKKDHDKNKPVGSKCFDCGRTVPDNALTEVDGTMICGRCSMERREAAKQKRKFSGVSDHHFESHDRKRLFVMIGIMVILLAIIIWSRLHPSS